MDKLINFIRKKTVKGSSEPGILILRDYLAVDRTRMANDRSALAHISTGVTVLAAGVSGFNLFDHLIIRSLSIMLVVTGISIVVIGIIRYSHMEKRLSLLGTPDYAELIQEMTKKSAIKDNGH